MLSVVFVSVCCLCCLCRLSFVVVRACLFAFCCFVVARPFCCELKFVFGLMIAAAQLPTSSDHCTCLLIALHYLLTPHPQFLGTVWGKSRVNGSRFLVAGFGSLHN